VANDEGTPESLPAGARHISVARDGDLTCVAQCSGPLVGTAIGAVDGAVVGTVVVGVVGAVVVTAVGAVVL
jgi:hypothetical protein